MSSFVDLATVLSLTWESHTSKDGLYIETGLGPIRRQAFIWTSAGLLSIGPLGTNFSEILIKI